LAVLLFTETMIGRIILVVCLFAVAHNCCRASTRDLAALKKGEHVGGLRCANLYADSEGHIVGAKFWDVRSGAPIYLLQIETIPQVFMWVDTPADSNKGVAHALEHLLGGKGTKGRYISLLKEMRLSRSVAATTDDFNLYSFSSGTGLDGFFEQFHAWLVALYQPDFTDLEAEREFYHFGISVDPATKKKTLVEKGSVYDEMQAGQGIYQYYFELNKRVFGPDNPFGFYNSGVPDEMRHVIPADIRRFHHEHYRLGPTTGFIFALSPKEDAFSFLHRISQEVDQFTDSDAPQQIHKEVIKPKYSIHPLSNKKIALFPFPSNSESDRGEIRFGWEPVKTESQVNLRLLQLFFRALADGDKSLLYKSLIDSKTREFGSGATNVESLVFLENSPYFPAEFVGFSGIAGKQLTVERIEQLRNRVTAAIRRISQYPDGSQSLVDFNQLVMSYAKAWRRSQSVWTKSAPQFGLNYETQWKEHLEYLEMDPSFTRSISDEPIWRAVERRMQSGRNIWGGLIRDFHLLEVPYATASVPSEQLLEELDNNRQKRIAAKIKQTMDRFHTDDEQQALARFEQEETIKTKEVDEIAAHVRQPRFTDHPPLTPDDDIRYTQFHLDNVPVIATFFDRAPTIDLGLSFDLRRIPRRYYKYLPILPRCLDSLGLKTADKIISYADLQAQTQTEMNDFSVRYDFSPVSRRADLTIQASTTTPAEFRRALALIQRITTLNYLDPSNADRLRDVVDKRQWEENTYNQGENDFWFINPSNAFRYQDDLLYLALSSVFTRAHWDGRLKWLLHKPVPPAEIARLADFAEKALSASLGVSDKQLSETLSRSNAKGLEGELVEYWERNIPSFSQDELLPGLRRLAVEVQDDLKAGPAKTIADLRELQKIVLDRQALSIDLTLDQANLAEIQPSLKKFLESIPGSAHPEDLVDNASEKTPLMDNVRRRYNLGGSEFPWYVGLEDPRNTTANMVFYADFPGYSQLDRQSLLRELSSKLVSGSGPQTVYTKIEEDGLAYGSSISSDPRLRLLRYYAARSPDIPSLVNLVNSIAAAIPQLHDESLIDYALQQTFTPPRSMSTFTERGRGLATDIRDGNDPAQVRRFSEAILKLRAEPNLLSELTSLVADSICPVLVTNECAPQQQQARSLFFFTGPERLLADAEKKLGMRKMLRIYPSDFWIGDSRESNQASQKVRRTNTTVH